MVELGGEDGELGGGGGEASHLPPTVDETLTTVDNITSTDLEIEHRDGRLQNILIVEFGLIDRGINFCRDSLKPGNL